MNALYTFQLMMQSIFSKLEFSRVCIDKDTTYARTLHEHVVHLTHVLHIVTAHGT